MRRRGALFQAVGRKYIDQAAASARSTKRTNRWLGTCLFCDDLDYARDTHSQSFDEVIDIMDTPTKSYVDSLQAKGQLFGIKVPVALHSPFEETLLIDSDTVLVGDVSEAFDKLEYFDVLACEDAVHLVDTDTSRWQATGLVDLHNRGYFNSGVLFFNNSPRVCEFLNEWADIYASDDPFASRNDQDALNYVLGRPAQFMDNLSFSPTAIQSQQFNAACRFWMELWEAGMWDDVRIVHTWMSQMIEARMAHGTMNWPDFFYQEAGAGPEYVRRFSIARDLLTPLQKKNLYDKIRKSPVDLRQYLQHITSCLEIESKFDRLSNLYCVDQNGFGVDYLQMIANAKIHLPKNPSILQIGVGHYVAGQSGFNASPHYRVGYDLEFLREAFNASSVAGLTRLRYTGYRRNLTKTSYCSYDAGLGSKDTWRADLIIDADASLPASIRTSNLEALVKDPIPGSIIYVSDVSKEGFLMLERLAKRSSIIESISTFDRQDARDVTLRVRT